ncbi:MAG: M23 family metallopeptidase [Crocinitomicaceae bacterium]|nr:M23 family metallopeptidase [Crocinitomicaceae bacterium]
MLACIPAIQPIANEDLTRLSSGYGFRIDPIYKTQKMHWGIDFTAETGTNVYASGNGVVKDVEEKLWGYGTSVIIDHGFGYTTRYAHLSGYTVKKGDKITRGQLIGYVGSSGKSTAPHLHYEVEKNGVKINPIHFFHSDVNSEEYERLLEMSNSANQTFD